MAFFDGGWQYFCRLVVSDEAVTTGDVCGRQTRSHRHYAIDHVLNMLGYPLNVLILYFFAIKQGETFRMCVIYRLFCCYL